MMIRSKSLNLCFRPSTENDVRENRCRVLDETWAIFYQADLAPSYPGLMAANVGLAGHVLDQHTVFYFSLHAVERYISAIPRGFA